MASAEGRKGLMTTAIVVLLLSLTGAGAGFAVGVLLQPAKSSESAPASQPAAEAQAPPETGKAPEQDQTATGEQLSEEEAGEPDVMDPALKIVPIPPVLTTLAEPAGKWIRLEGSILAKPAEGKTPELLAEQSGERILTYLRTVKLSQLQGPSGFLSLRDDLNETVRSLSNGEVQAVLIHGLLVE